MTSPRAISPATSNAVKSTTSNVRGPRNAPIAPTNFQSPAPNALTITKGKSTSKPNPAPASAILAPAHPPAIVFTVSPTIKPETVSQLGIRRERQSVHPAVSAKSPANASVISFIGRKHAAGEAFSSRRTGLVNAIDLWKTDTSGGNSWTIGANPKIPNTDCVLVGGFSHR